MNWCKSFKETDIYSHLENSMHHDGLAAGNASHSVEIDDIMRPEDDGEQESSEDEMSD